MIVIMISTTSLHAIIAIVIVDKYIYESGRNTKLTICRNIDFNLHPENSLSIWRQIIWFSLPFLKSFINAQMKC